MQAQSNVGLIRLGILALPLAGLLLVVYHIVSANVPDTSVDPAGAARAVSATDYLVSGIVGAVLGIVLLIFGFFTLFAYLVDTRGRRLATLAMVLGVTGIALQLSFTGIIVYALPVVGKAYLAGQHGALDIGNGFFEGPAAGIIFPLAFLIYSAGGILFGIAIWRSGTLPKWAGVLFAIHGPLMAGPFPISVALVGSAVLLLSTVWIALSILARPSVQMETEAQSRVQ